jgi:hypothetical protein
MEVIETIFGADNVETFIKDNKFGLDAVFGTVL